MPKQSLKTKIKNWFSRPIMRHVVSGLIVLTLQNVLINQNIDPQTASQAAALLGKAIGG